MNLQRRIVESAAIGVGVVESAAGFDLIHKPGVAAVLWRRQFSPLFQSWVDGIAPGQLPDARLVLRPQDVETAVSHICEIAGLPSDESSAALAADVAMLAEAFSGAIGSTFLRLRLDVVTDNACRKFHIDNVTARLVCTYRGTGTQYGISTDGEEPRRVFMVQTGSPIIFRGALWPDLPPSGLMHRSPPIEGTGETRLLLVLDPIDDPDEAV